MLLGRVTERKAVDHRRCRGFCCASRADRGAQKPNYYPAAEIAKATGNKREVHNANRADDPYYKDLIHDYLRKFGLQPLDDLKGLFRTSFADAYRRETEAEQVFAIWLYANV